MIGAVAAWILRRGLVKTIPGAEKAAKVVRWILIVFAVLAVLGVGKCSYDKSVISDHESKQAAEAAKAALEGERRANADQEKRDAVFDEEQSKIEKGISDEIAKDPIGAAKPVGPGQRGFFDSLPNDERPKPSR